jgi:hypothetical protein
MTLKERISRLVTEAIRVTGTGHALAERLGVTPQAVTNWKNRHDAPSAQHLIRMQDLVKRAACVIVALGLSAQAPDSGATGYGSAPPAWQGSSLGPACQLRIMLNRLRRLGSRFWRLLRPHHQALA